MIEELKARIEAALKEEDDINFYAGGSSVNYSQRQLGAFVMVNQQTIISALSAVPVMKEALEDVADALGIIAATAKDVGFANHAIFFEREAAARQALAALEPKP